MTRRTMEIVFWASAGLALFNALVLLICLNTPILKASSTVFLFNVLVLGISTAIYWYNLRFLDKGDK